MDIRSGSLSCLLPGDTKSQYIDHQKAAVYVVSDYLSEKYEPEPEPDEKPESEEETEHKEEPDSSANPNNKNNTEYYRQSIFSLLFLLF